MTSLNGLLPPVVIGAVGGSGTRVLADTLERSGFSIGTDLNNAKDNTHFTLLFKRPEWLRQNWSNAPEIDKRLAILAKIENGVSLNREDRLIIRESFRDLILKGHTAEGDGRGLWGLNRLRKFILNRQPTLGARGWGWKEPNSHMLLHRLPKAYPGMKYIHLMRNGFDMAFSGNQQQFLNWASLFDVEIPSDPAQIPAASYQYWLRANTRAMEIGKAMGDQHFLFLRFEDMVDKPRETMERIGYFLDIPMAEFPLDELAALPRRPKTSGRSQGKDLSAIPEQDREAALAFGYQP